MTTHDTSLEADGPLEAPLGDGITEELPVATYRTAPDGTLTAVNSAFVQLLGYSSREAMLGQELEGLTLDPDAVSLWRRQLHHSDEPAGQRTTLRSRSGQHVPVLLQGAPLRDGQGSLLGIVGIALDLRSPSADLDTLVAQHDPKLGVGALPEVHHAIADSAEAMGVGVLLAILDEDAAGFVVTYANDASLEVLDRARAEVLDAHLDTLLPGLREAARGHGPAEITLPRADGRNRIVEANLARTNTWGAPSAIIHLRDITQRREVELAVRESEEAVRTLIEHTTVGFYRTTPEGQIIMANPALVDILSFESMEDLLARDLSTWGYAEDRSREDWQERLEREGTLTEETTWLNAQSEPVHVRESARIVRDEDGSPRYYEGTVEDITDLKRQESMLERENRRQRAIRRILELPQRAPDFQRLVEALAHSVADIFETGRAAVLLLHEDDEELDIAGVHDDRDEGAPLEGTRVTREMIPELWKKRETLERNSRPLRVPDLLEQVEDDHLRERLQEVDATGSIYVPLYRNGNLRGVLAISESRSTREFTERDLDLAQEVGQYASLVLSNALLDQQVREGNDALREANQELERSNEDLQNFASALSHDLREPNRMVQGFLDLFLERHGDDIPPEGRELLEEAEAGADRMGNLITGLLTLSRVGSRHESRERVELGSVLENVERNLQVAIEDAGAEVTWDDLPVVKADPNLLGQALQNLVENALKYRREDVPPRVHIRAHRPENAEGMWRVEVEDNGQGLDPDDRERVFDLFQQVDPGEGSEGIGLGLALVKRIVDHHGGEVGTTSTKGEGSTFWFTLPAVDPAE